MAEEAPYTSRELKELFRELKEGNDRIEAQVIKTNGRVSSLESWKNFITGGMAVLTMFFVPIFLYMVYHSFKQ